MDLFRLTIFLFLIAALIRSELFFYLLYVIVGLQLVARFWVRGTARRLRWKRTVPPAAFPGETTTISLELENTSVLPVPWLALHESLGAGLRSPPMVREVLSLGAGERQTLSYTVTAQRRGYYQIGPLALRTGDVLGLGEQALEDQSTAAITIYPTILPLPELGLPASLPYGTLQTRQRLFADPARPIGVRPYQASDGVRRIDWKSSAHAGVPLVRRYQPAIALETMIALAFSRSEYGGRFEYDTMERALVAAASLAAFLNRQRQPVGLCATGFDPQSNQPAATIAPNQGRAHLMRLLGVLGRLEASVRGELPMLAYQASAQLGWGATLIVITGQRGTELVQSLLPLQRRGLNLALIITEPTPADLALPQRHGIASYGLWRDGRPAKR
jgi:uncharacterized protein (DUF58 family)